MQDDKVVVTPQSWPYQRQNYTLVSMHYMAQSHTDIPYWHQCHLIRHFETNRVHVQARPKLCRTLFLFIAIVRTSSKSICQDENFIYSTKLNHSVGCEPGYTLRLSVARLSAPWNDNCYTQCDGIIIHVHKLNCWILALRFPIDHQSVGSLIISFCEEIVTNITPIYW